MKLFVYKLLLLPYVSLRTEGDDYVAADETVIFNVGSPNVIPCVRITLIDDAVIEPRENFMLILESIPPVVCTLIIDSAVVYIDGMCVCVCVLCVRVLCVCVRAFVVCTCVRACVHVYAGMYI